MKLVTLKQWAELNFDPPPSLNTIRKWARDGLLSPAPTKHGRAYYTNPMRDICHRQCTKSNPAP
ncbi:excisionase [Pseudomonas citronellolis]|uniref:excisionase n=1 Tax=Pseudomonas citronellolis TaxID=53408 RepID=UPI003C2D8019